MMATAIKAESTCPCGSGQSYADCCQLLHNGAPAASPEALMRSRYSAFVMFNVDYLLSSWDERTRPAELTFETDTHWSGLTLHESSHQQNNGTVRFTACFREGSEWLQLTELSRFCRGDDGFWRYLDGDASFRSWQPGRNDNCPCGSGKKFKKCCAC